MGRIMLWSRDHAVLVMILLFLGTAFFGYQIKDVRLDASPHRLMIPGTPEVEFYKKTRDTFGSDNMTVVYVKDRNLFTYEKLKAVEEVFYKFQDLKGVSRVDGIFNAKVFKNENGTLQTNSLLDPVPEGPAQIEKAKQDALKNPVLVDMLIRKDATGIAINIVADPAESEKNPNADNDLANEIDKLIEPLKGKVDEVWQVGAPMTRRLITHSLLNDQATLIPMAVLILLAMIFVCLRTVHGSIVPLVGGIISVTWTVGFMCMVHVPIQILTVIIPAIIIVIGSAEDMHMIGEYFEAIEHGHDRKGAVEHIAKQLGLAVLFTALTTIIGFLSISINEMPLLQEFGYIAAFGITVSLFVTLVFGPAYLVLFGETKSPFAHKGEGQGPKHGWFEKLGEITLQIVKDHKTVALSGCLALVAGSIYGMTQIRVDNDLLANFKPKSEIRMKSQQLHEELSGAQSFYIVIDGVKEGAFKKAENVGLVHKIQNQLDEMKLFDASISLANHIALINREMSGGSSDKYVIPEKDNLISQYLLLLPREDIDRYVTADFKQANIIVRHNLSSSFDLKQAMTTLKANVEKILSGSGLTFQITSESILINDAADSIASGQAYSLSLTLTIIFILMSILFVNVKAGLLSIVPSLIPIFILFGVMGILGVPLNPGTSMVADIAIGITVDNTTHLMVRYHNQMKGNARLSPWDTIATTVRAEVRPMMTTTIALSLAFISLAISSFMPLVYFGLLSAMVLIIGIFADLIITPMLLSIAPIVTLWEMLGLHLREKVIKSSPLFRNMRPWQIKKVVLLGQVKTFRNGDLVYAQGTKEKSMYLILNGMVRTEYTAPSGKAEHKGSFFIGEAFGEIGMVSDITRSETVIAAADKTELLLLDWDALDAIRKNSPTVSTKILTNIARILGNRLALISHTELLHKEAKEKAVS